MSLHRLIHSTIFSKMSIDYALALPLVQLIAEVGAQELFSKGNGTAEAWYNEREQLRLVDLLGPMCPSVGCLQPSEVEKGKA